MQMYYTFLSQLSIIMSAAGVATCFICLSLIGFSHFSKHQKHQFRLFFASTLVYLFSTLLWDILHYIDYSESEIVLFKTLTLFQYLSPGFMSFMMCRTIISVIDVHRHIRLISGSVPRSAAGWSPTRNWRGSYAGISIPSPRITR